MRVVRLAVGVALLASLLGGCRTSNLAFRATDRISMQRPSEMERVALPVTLRWKADGVKTNKDLDGTGPFYAVFVDRAPVPAGTGLRTLLDDDCRQQKDCPDLAWYAERDVYVTGEPHITLTRLPSLGNGTRTAGTNNHRAVVVLIGEDGVRLDESAAAVTFEVAES
jgi:hypothetical protein